MCSRERDEGRRQRGKKDGKSSLLNRGRVKKGKVKKKNDRERWTKRREAGSSRPLGPFVPERARYLSLSGLRGERGQDFGINNLSEASDRSDVSERRLVSFCHAMFLLFPFAPFLCRVSCSPCILSSDGPDEQRRKSPTRIGTNRRRGPRKEKRNK